MEDYYSVLGVSPNATAGEIKRVYLKLAQKFHPDRHTKTEEKKQAHEVFSRITAAYRTLSDDKLRAKYDESRAKRSTDADEARDIQAKNLFARALEHINNGEPWPAVNLLRTACSYSSSPLYLSYLGLAQVYTKRNEKDGFKKLEHAVKQEMFNPILHFNLGLAQEFVGRDAEALRSYREVLNWNPNHKKAQLAVRRLSVSKKGFFSKLFRSNK